MFICLKGRASERVCAHERELVREKGKTVTELFLLLVPSPNGYNRSGQVKAWSSESIPTLSACTAFLCALAGSWIGSRAAGTDLFSGMQC